MVNTYKITIKNNTGSLRWYSLFNKEPEVNGNVQGKVWSTVFACASCMNGGTLEFTITRNYHAVVGASQEQPGDQVAVSMIDSREVTLGSTQAGKGFVSGSSLEVIVRNSTPLFSDKTLPNGSLDDCFEIQTGVFDAEEAKKGRSPGVLVRVPTYMENRIGKYMIGYGIKGQAGLQGPLSSFCPAPNVKYQIRPVNTFYVNPARFKTGTMIDEGVKDTSAEVDFAHLPDNVVISHDTYDILTIQAA